LGDVFETVRSWFEALGETEWVFWPLGAALLVLIVYLMWLDRGNP
jgi:hypothetical protein